MPGAARKPRSGPPRRQFSDADAEGAGRYYGPIRMAMLAYFAPPNALWETGYDLINDVPNDADVRALAVSAEDEPRGGLPSHPSAARGAAARIPCGPIGRRLGGGGNRPLGSKKKTNPSRYSLHMARFAF